MLPFISKRTGARTMKGKRKICHRLKEEKLLMLVEWMASRIWPGRGVQTVKQEQNGTEGRGKIAPSGTKPNKEQTKELKRNTSITRIFLFPEENKKNP